MTRLLAAAVAALALAGCGGSGAAGAPTPAPIAANLWVAPVAGKSPERCATPCAFDPDKAYGTFQAAYTAAAGGDRVRVKAGRYGTQRIDTPNPRITEPVTFEPAHGEAVRLGLLDTRADWITVRDMTIAAGRRADRGWRSAGSHVTLDHVNVTGPEATITLSGGSDVTYRDSELGTQGNTTPRRCANHNSEPLEVADTTRLTIENVTFWPFVPELGNPICGPDGNLHLETVRINDNVQHLVIDRARFMGGDESGSGRLFESGAGGKPSNDALIVNSYFAPSTGLGADIRLGNGGNRCDGWVFAYNYWRRGIDDAQCPVKPTYVGNLGPQPDYLPCPGSTPATTCGPGARRRAAAAPTAGSCTPTR